MIQGLLFVFAASLILMSVMIAAAVVGAIVALIVAYKISVALCRAARWAYQAHQIGGLERELGRRRARLLALRRVAAAEHEVGMLPHIDPAVLAACGLCAERSVAS